MPIRCHRLVHCIWLLAGAAACDSPRPSTPGVAPHEPWAPRVCEGGSGSFTATADGQSLGELDLCGLGPTGLEATSALPGLTEAQSRARAIVQGLSQADKLKLVQGAPGAYVGNVSGVAGLPPIILQDGPAGVAGFHDVTAFPAPIAFAASWDADLVESFGEAMGAEERGKGALIQLSPMMNLARTPAGGRIFEGFGEDPFLSGVLSAREVVGIQSQKVVATAKHYVGNEQETNRSGGDSQIDERTLHEIYYEPFAASIEAGVGAVMCSYNRINGAYACENESTLSALKSGLGFSGFVVSDWGATHSTAASANAGLDLEMPLGQYFGQLGTALDAGTVAPARLDDMATRILTALIRVGALDDPPSGTGASVVTSTAHATLARQAATESIVLLKNADKMLPLSATQSVLVVGEAGNTKPSTGGGGSSFVEAPYVVSPLAALRARTGVSVSYDDGTTNSVVSAAGLAGVAIVFVTVPSTEGADRPSLATGQDDLIARVAAANPNTIVVLNTPGAVLMPWLGSVRAVLVGWYPGQENGNALASVLYGDENPSGKLPLSFPASEGDLPMPSASLTVPYDEKLAIGYRALDTAGTKPLFPFGFGLSYTSFSYSTLSLAPSSTPGAVTASFNVTNTGDRAGAEVAQLYLEFPADAGEPPRLLRGFTRLMLAPGETQVGAIELLPRAFSCWSAATHSRYVPSGTYQIAVGASSRDLALHGSLTIEGT